MSSLAREIGIKPNYLSEIASGRKHPSLKTAGDIFIATGKRVPTTYWLVLAGDLEPDPAHEISL